MSCVHIFDVEKKDQDLSYLDRYLSKDGYVVVELFTREQGIIVAKGNPKGIRGNGRYCFKECKVHQQKSGIGDKDTGRFFTP